MTSANGALDRSALQRVVAVANGKGGVGKTSTATHLAGQVASAGRRVLLIDLDPQNNTKDDLGYLDSDAGKSIHVAVQAGTPLRVIRDVRKGLDVVAGGTELHYLADHIRLRQMRERGSKASLLEFARIIAEHAAGYDLVVIDCPPADSDVLQDAALAAAAYLLVPTHSDKSSREGLMEMARRMNDIRDINPTLRLLGVLLFGVGVQATTVRKLARQWVEAVLGDHAPVFEATIRHVEAVAFDVREKGRLAFELDGETSLGGDYQRMGVEVLRRLVALEAAR